MKIRSITANEVSVLRDTRLRALRDSPDAFGENFEAIAGRPTSYWNDQSAAVTEPHRNVLFLAFEGGDTLGMIYGLRDPEDKTAGRITGMWVDPSRRRSGIGRALLQAVLDWAITEEFKTVGLWVAVDNQSAIDLYRQAGFVVTEARGRLNEHLAIETLKMVFEL